MSETEMYCRLVCLERSLKKANYRIYLLEKRKDLVEESKKYFENKIKRDDSVQLELFEDAVGE